MTRAIVSARALVPAALTRGRGGAAVFYGRRDFERETRRIRLWRYAIDGGSFSPYFVRSEPRGRVGHSFGRVAGSEGAFNVFRWIVLKRRRNVAYENLIELGESEQVVCFESPYIRPQKRLKPFGTRMAFRVYPSQQRCVNISIDLNSV